MLLAWLGLSPLGTYIARNYKLAGPLWFQLHRGAQVNIRIVKVAWASVRSCVTKVLAVVLALIGWVIILTDNDVGEQGTHHRMGTATIALAFIQVCLAFGLGRLSSHDSDL